MSSKRNELSVSMALDQRDALVNILMAHGFSVQHSRGGLHGKRPKIVGDSGLTYLPHILARRKDLNLFCRIRTRGQRGRGKEIDRGAIQLLYAELADLEGALETPHALIASPYGIEKDALTLSKHFSIIVAVIPSSRAQEICQLDPAGQREDILRIANELEIRF